jgi:cysteine synthase A
MKVAKDLTELIGGTPLLDVSDFRETKARVIAKLEMFNPLSSVKDRIAYAMIDQAEKDGLLKPGATIIEPTSGNTGVGLAFVAASRGYHLILTMPETMSIERRKLLAALGAEVVLTDGYDAMPGAIKKAEELAAEIPGSFIPQQFDNPANPEIHRQTTAQEILEDMDGNVDIFISGVGTGGTLTGVGEVLKQNNPDVQIIAVEPFQSSVLSGHEKALHRIQGIGAGFIPSVLEQSLIDEIIRIKDDDAGDVAREIAKTKGLLCGISSGAALWAAFEVAARPENEGKVIVTILPDTGERYLSTWLYEDFSEDLDQKKEDEFKEEKRSASELAMYYFKNGLSCSEAMLKAFNEKYKLGLPEHSLSISSGFGAGLGESGCACGAMTGAIMVFGLIAGRKKAYESNRLVFLATNELHRRFIEKNRSSCCRVLTRGVDWYSAEQKERCEGYELTAATIAEEIIETQLRELLPQDLGVNKTEGAS